MFLFGDLGVLLLLLLVLLLFVLVLLLLLCTLLLLLLLLFLLLLLMLEGEDERMDDEGEEDKEDDNGTVEVDEEVVFVVTGEIVVIKCVGVICWVIGNPVNEACLLIVFIFSLSSLSSEIPLPFLNDLLAFLSSGGDDCSCCRSEDEGDLEKFLKK